MSSRIFDKDYPPPTVGALMRLAWNEFRDRMYNVVTEAGFTDLQPTHLLLFRYPTIIDMRPSDLADQIGVTKQALNDLLRQLENKGYLELKPDPDDRRAKRIRLTKRGLALADLTRNAAQQVSDEWSQAVGQKRFDMFRKTLADLVERSG
jgi:DNA-binding MarR family transcriptional regulator